MELKDLPTHLRYASLRVNESLCLIISSNLSKLHVEASINIEEDEKNNRLENVLHTWKR